MTTTSSSSQNMSSGSSGDASSAAAAAGGGGGWLVFSLSPHMAPPPMDAADGSGGVQPQHQGALFYPPVASSASPFCYAVGGHDSVVAAGGAGIYPGISSVPLTSEGSLCFADAFRRSDQEHKGVVSSSGSPKLEDFLGVVPAMALSLDNSAFYYGGHGHGPEHGAFLQPMQCGVIPGAGGHDDVHGGGDHAPLVDHESAEALAASWLAAARAGGGYVDHGGAGMGAIVPVGPGHPHPLALSMSSGSQTSCVTMHAATHAADCITMEGSKKRGGGAAGEKQTVHRKSIDTFGQRTSQYRGVTRHRWTGRYEAHLWDNSYLREGHTRKGRQAAIFHFSEPLVTPGTCHYCIDRPLQFISCGYDMEEKAARAYDLAALKYWGPSTHINFPLEDYSEELEEMNNMTRQEYVAHLRRNSTGFSRGASIYRGVTRHHHHGRWQARIGRVSGNKDLYLGTFATQEEAAEAYDVAAIKFRGLSAVTNFGITRYDVDKIMASSTLLPSELARRKDGEGDTGAAVGASGVDAVASAAASLVQTGNTGNDGWNIQVAAAAAAARTVAPCGDGRQQQHQEFLPSEAFSVLHDIVSVDGGAAQGSNAGAHDMSNASSLAASVSNSREQSPDRGLGGGGGGGLAMFFARPPSEPAASPLSFGSWATSPSPLSARPGVSIAHMPMFAAWSDA
ncbi:hypothetical protein ACP4OV_008264 [Aristida adscensionis]